MSGKVFHAPFVDLHGGFELVGAWERSKKLIEQDYPSANSFASIDSILQDESVELVIVNTPTYTHYEYAKKVLAAGKHAVVEKAFTTKVDEAIELRELAKKNGLILSVFQNRRWDSDFLTVKKVVETGLLGEIVEATFCYHRYNPDLSPKAHKETPGPGAGIVYDLGPHLIDQALTLFGMPHSVYADIMTTRKGSKVEDYFEILLFYQNSRVRLHGGYFVREPVPSFVVHGKSGSFLKSRADVQEAMLQKGILPKDKTYGIEPETEEGLLHSMVDGKVIREKVKSLNGNYLYYYDGIYNSIREGVPVDVTADDGVRIAQVIEATYKSSRERMIVEL
jgi:predicted dehydrogenase